MRRLATRRLLASGLPFVLSCCLSSALADDASSRSTWKIVEAPEPTVPRTAPADSSAAPSESFEPTPTPLVPSGVSQESASPTPVGPPQPTRPVIARRPPVAFAMGSQRNRASSAQSHLGRAGSYPAPQQTPGRTSGPSASLRSAHRPTKPFQTLAPDPTVSAYLGLYRDENSQELPNYFAFVRPQMEQQEANWRQQREIQKLQRQVQQASTTVVGSQYDSNAPQATGHTARFMDTAQFYERWSQ